MVQIATISHIVRCLFFFFPAGHIKSPAQKTPAFSQHSPVVQLTSSWTLECSRLFLITRCAQGTFPSLQAGKLFALTLQTPVFMWHFDDQKSQSALSSRVGHDERRSPKQELHQPHQQKEGVLRTKDTWVIFNCFIFS